MAARATTRKAAAPVVEPDEVEDEFEEIEEDEDLEELEEVEEDETPKPKGKSTKAAQAAKAANAPKFGSAQLAAHITEVTGEAYDARGVRMLLRKLAKDGTLARVVGETRDRYSFEGPNDPIVKAVVTMVKDGTAKALKQEGLEKVKTQAAAKKAAAAAAKAAEAETDEDDEEEMEEVEETPKPRARRVAKAAAPAKATPAKATPRRKAPASA